MIKKAAWILIALCAALYLFLVIYTNYISPSVDADGSAGARSWQIKHNDKKNE